LRVDVLRGILNRGDGTGKAIFEGYIQILNKYHKEFFSRTSIIDIEPIMLREFDSWRIEKLGRNPAKSTILDHIPRR